MSFTYAMFLFGALAVIGPIVAHLWATPRYRRVSFAMIRFLQLGRQENQSRQNLKNWLVLLMRCAIIVLLAMMFAGPKWLTGTTTRSARPAVYIAVDDSLSMAYRDGGATIFDRAIAEARKTVASANDAMFFVYGVASGAQIERAGAIEADVFLKKMRVSARAADFSTFANAIRDARTAAVVPASVEAVVISDFTRSATTSLGTIDGVRVNAVRSLAVGKNDAENVAVVDAHAANEGETLRIVATVANGGATKQSRRVTLVMDGQTLGEVNVDVASGQTSSATFDAVTLAQRYDRWLPIEIRLSADDGLKEDDVFCLPVFVPATTTQRVLLVGNDARELFLMKTAAMAMSQENGDAAGANENVIVRTFGQVSVAEITEADVLVISAMRPTRDEFITAIQRVLARGGRVIFFASESPSAVSEVFEKAGLAPTHDVTFRSQPVRLQPMPMAGDAADESHSMRMVLGSYRLDRLAIEGSFACRPDEKSVCVWQFANGEGFVYRLARERGCVVWVNGTLDGTLATLMKSSAAVPFCRYLFGQTQQLETNCVRVGEAVRFTHLTPRAYGYNMRVTTATGETLAMSAEADAVACGAVNALGWCTADATVPAYAGVNCGVDETNVVAVDVDAVRSQLARAFVASATTTAPADEMSDEKTYRSLWVTVAWMTIVLIACDAFITNRMQR